MGPTMKPKERDHKVSQNITGPSLFYLMLQHLPPVYA